MVLLAEGNERAHHERLPRKVRKEGKYLVGSIWHRDLGNTVLSPEPL